MIRLSVELLFEIGINNSGPNRNVRVIFELRGDVLMKRELTEQEKAADKCTSEVLDAFHRKMRSLSLLATSQLTHAKANRLP